MKKFLFLFSVLVYLNSWAQPGPFDRYATKKPYSWMIGTNWMVIDDNGNQFGDLFDVSNSWNLLPYPSRISFDKYFHYGWSIEASAGFMQYKLGKIINDSTNVEGIHLNIDILAKKSWYYQFGKKARWIDPYVVFGLGYTFRDAGATQHVPHLTAGLGVNFWATNWLGFQLSGQAKLGIYPLFWTEHDNYLQYNAGLVFRFSNKKKRDNSFSKRKNKWHHKKAKYKGNRR